MVKNKFLLIIIVLICNLSFGDIKSIPDSILIKKSGKIVDSLRKNEVDGETIFFYGKKLFELKKDEDAKKLFEYLLKQKKFLLESNLYLGHIFLRQPKVFFYPLYQLKKLFKKDPFSKAITYYTQVINLSPDSVIGYYYKGIAYLKKKDENDLKKGFKLINKGIELNKNYKDIIFQKAIFLYRLNKYGSSISTILDYLQLNPDDKGRAYYYIALNYHEIKNIKKFTSYFYKAMDYLYDDDIANEILNYMSPLLNEKKYKEILKKDAHSKAIFIKNFWITNDSDFSTIENERLFEHISRCNYVYKNYATDFDKRGFDDRGMIYIRFGPPSNIFRSNYSNTDVYSNESWVYEKGDEEICFDFMRSENTYKLIPSLKSAIRDYMKNYKLLYNLYSERSHIGHVYENYSNKLMSIGIDRGSQDEYFRYNEIAQNYIYTNAEKIAKYSKDVSQTKALENYFNIIMHEYQFGSNTDSTEIYFDLAIPTQSLYLARASDIYAFLNLSITILAENITTNEIIRFDNQEAFYYKTKKDISYFTVFRQKIKIKPGTYNFIINVKDQNSKRSGIIRKTIKILNYYNKLQLSDIFIGIPKNNDSIPTNIEYLTPYPFTVIKKSNKNFVYFKIYNLKKYQNYYNFDISYKITSIKPQINIIKKFFRSLKRAFTGKTHPSVEYTIQRYGKGTDAIEFYELDLKNVLNGVNLLEITVKDNIADKTVSKKYEFTLID